MEGLRRELDANTVLSSLRQAEIAASRAQQSSLESQVREALAIELKSLEGDFGLEHRIHLMKGRPYSICVCDQKKGSDLFRASLDSLQLRVPSQPDSWGRQKFDCMISRDLDLATDFSYPQYMLSLCRESLSLKHTQKPGVTFLVLSAHNRLAKLEEYLHALINEFASQKREVRISTAGPLGGEPTEVKSVHTCLTGSLSGNRAVDLDVSAPSGELPKTRIRFLLLDAEDSKNLESLQRRARESRQSRTKRRKSTVESAGGMTPLQKVFSEMQLCYLLVVLDYGATAGTEEVEYLYRIVQVARVMAEFAVADKVSYVPAQARE